MPSLLIGLIQERGMKLRRVDQEKKICEPQEYVVMLFDGSRYVSNYDWP